ncbi:unnamed protein product [Paramecium sonneborni]|uniref:MORN repeat protein n=1 Tax=Paramecium sonneborni TaxID=65129 RepID=A0A8S1NPI7_9CILI|nr:unnamed protein product [Paramecium sonneborni]
MEWGCQNCLMAKLTKEQEYDNDKKHGKGVFKWEDGRKYAGCWKQNKQHGIGIYLSNQNVEKIGYWEEGVRIKWYEEKEIRLLEQQGILDEFRNL